LAAVADDEKWRKENEVIVYGKVIQRLGDKLYGGFKKGCAA
jgi:hypothetical protein